mmetsp:Transcript_565/g.928  ORF Transcript_565/g.928 Transcript_565/m.928 type:complete len:236 (+) Transcript_565:986-1693(+)
MTSTGCNGSAGSALSKALLGTSRSLLRASLPQRRLQQQLPQRDQRKDEQIHRQDEVARAGVEVSVHDQERVEESRQQRTQRRYSQHIHQQTKHCRHGERHSSHPQQRDTGRAASSYIRVLNAAQNRSGGQVVSAFTVRGSAGRRQVLTHTQIAEVTTQRVMCVGHSQAMQHVVDDLQLRTDGAHGHYVHRHRAEDLDHEQVLHQRHAQHDAPRRGRGTAVRGSPGKRRGQEERSR